ncbi:MAG: arylamine N-acetyltransferase [Sandaracinaceae bacterium]|nr:arylamine N-acetyltransferase [Sandaracinaceae bacterium]
MTLLSGGRVDAYLSRLRTTDIQHDGHGLMRLHAAHLMAVPYHNLRGLGQELGEPAPLEEAVDDAIAGVGGSSDRTTVPFTLLLQSLGFDARLVSAQVKEPNDHVVCVVTVGGRRFLCDVGNGWPCLRPWVLDADVQEQQHQGQRFRFVPRSPRGPELLRVLPDGTTRTACVVDAALRLHGGAPLGGASHTLRATSVRTDVVLSLSGLTYRRDTRFGRFERRVCGREGLEALLVGPFGLPLALVGRALDHVARWRPDLLVRPRWFALGCGEIGQSAGLPVPPRRVVPDVLITLATVGREASVSRLLDSLDAEVRESGYPGRVGALIVDNHDAPRAATTVSKGGTTHYRIPITNLRATLDEAAAAGAIPAWRDGSPAPIGVARTAQLAALRAHLEVPLVGLPHPTNHPTVVWMVDDDVAFCQLGADGEPRRRTNLLYRAARYWAEMPQHAVVLGTFTGDPPVPGLDCLEGQLSDLVACVRGLLAVGPYGSWQPPPTPAPVFDAYYDLTESERPGSRTTWPYAAHQVGEPARAVALRLLLDIPRLLDGQQLTRPLTWDGDDADPRPSMRRGGNALFLDLDALFRWPTPVLTTSDGVTTRRADTIWAALAAADDPTAVVEATLPLLHGREGQRAELGTDPSVDAALHSAAQLRGVVLARAVAGRRSIPQELAARERKVSAHRARVRRRLVDLGQWVREFLAWHCEDIDEAIEPALRALHELGRRTEREIPAGDPAELEAFVRDLPASTEAWRGIW